MIQAWTNTAPGRIERRTLPLPEPAAGQVRIRTLACGICATDLEMVAGWSRTGHPTIPGHEWCGLVEAIGEGVDACLIGRRCVGDNVLADGGEVGFEHPGGYAEAFLTAAANLRLLPEECDPATATLIEPLAVCLRGLRRLLPLPAGGVLIVGDGAIGLLATGLLVGDGANPVTVVGGVPERLALARQLGAAACDHRQFPPMPLFPTVIEASGSPAGLDTALAHAANQGQILILGDYAEARAGFRWNDLLHRELCIVGSNAGTGAWDEAIARFLAAPRRFAPLVTHRLPACDCPRALELARTRKDGVLRAVIIWE
ncbi:MAG: alcohol dehydrogenase catalytic domain-containing protein [Lentisphaeria bacterium]|jgi:threonine dehydrogenase-like Zn-dependent dehydrogenase|nr:alcohol dehydrogenase catalytic domain-containing protein [Lentisphaeria bacterium]